MLPKLEGLLQHILRYSAESPFFMLTCGGLALLGTVTAAYPVTTVVVPAALLLPQRWKSISFWTALGSALGATLLVISIHHMGWAALYEHYPQLASHPDWQRIMSWVDQFGITALFVLAISPLPQTPGLIFFGIAWHDYLLVFLAMLAGKLLKYAAFAYVTKQFPNRFERLFHG
jgi:membrane protein YqaA with SNARE-associated domain